ncbi:hypothetical protein [Paenibacillus cymbidii]|uniref:hypothetical protein n=1 Tax=Paenibacillus cymbidii TaxID=1639034 RepID=UPI0010801303|nr:hypothetical protein [Paenibacillus cymbidii]
MGESKDNVVLFPKSIEFYQEELTRLLESDRFAEAAETLRFLLACDNGDAATAEEWRMLLEWLETHMAANPAAAALPEAEDEEEAEADLLRAHVAAKREADAAYEERLLQMLLAPESPPARQQQALEQLAALGERRVVPAVADWLAGKEHNPLLQFAALQSLRRLGMTGECVLVRSGKPIAVDVGNVPLGLAQFPEPFVDVLRRVQSVLERLDPTLASFAERLWEEYGTYLYGSEEYAALTLLDEEGRAAWAGALHLALEGTIGGIRRPDQIAELYGVGDATFERMRAAVKSLRTFLAAVQPLGGE